MRLRWLLALLLTALSLAGCPADSGPGAFLDDRAGVLGPLERQRLTGQHDQLLRDLDIHLRVIILDRPVPDLTALAVELFDRAGRANFAADTRGVLLLVDPAGGRVRMEIGYDLEGTFPDAFIGYIQERQMKPFFAAGRIGDGVAATVELLVRQAFGTLDSDRYRLRRAPPLPHGSGGARAGSEAPVGRGRPAAPAVSDPAAFAPRATPLASLVLYRQVLSRHIKDPDLLLYTPETRRFFHHWVVTDAQQDNELRALDQAWARARVIINGSLAVIRFPIADRRNPPYFLRRSHSGWQLDLAAQNRLILFNHRNQWHFRNLDHGYMFGFRDWHFDAHGFPHRVEPEGGRGTGDGGRGARGEGRGTRDEGREA